MNSRLSQIKYSALVFMLSLACFSICRGGLETYGEKEPDVSPPVQSKDWVRLGKPRPGEWLYVFDEPGQTFQEYKDDAPNRKSNHRNKIYIVPLGKIRSEHTRIIKLCAEYYSYFFDTPVVQLEPQPLPDRAFDKTRRQYDAGQLLRNVMVPLAQKRDDELAVVGFTHKDLYHGKLNFVFGVGSLRNRTGVYSIHRLIAEGANAEEKTLLRTLKLGSHEIGHILGMQHCTFYECVMNGSNSLQEADARQAFLCPVCVRKLEWNLQFDRLKRYKNMCNFFKKTNLKKQAAFCQRRIDELKEIEKQGG